MRFAQVRRARRRRAILLGDLFDAWIGDDQLREPLASASPWRLRGVAECRRAGGHPRRQSRFPARRAIRRRPPAQRCCRSRSSINLAGTPTLLLHGDELCTETSRTRISRGDARIRSTSARSSRFPISLRRGVAACLRRKSRARNRRRSPNRSSTSSSGAVEAAFRAANVDADDPRPHASARAPQLVVDGRACERCVLADWYDRGSYLEFDADGGRTRDV